MLPAFAICPDRRANRGIHGGEAGFTLIEILVVMVILGLTASVVVLSLPNDEARTRQAAEQLAARLHILSQSAAERGVMTGLAVSDTGYQFVMRRLGGWARHPDVGDGGLYPWPDGLDISLEIEGEQVPFDSEIAADRAPLIYFTPSGETRPFSIELFDRRARTSLYIVSGSVAQPVLTATPQADSLLTAGDVR